VRDHGRYKRNPLGLGARGKMIRREMMLEGRHAEEGEYSRETMSLMRVPFVTALSHKKPLGPVTSHRQTLRGCMF
jgi:hypothetical protein